MKATITTPVIITTEVHAYSVDTRKKIEIYLNNPEPYVQAYFCALGSDGEIIKGRDILFSKKISELDIVITDEDIGKTFLEILTIQLYSKFLESNGITGTIS